MSRLLFAALPAAVSCATIANGRLFLISLLQQVQTHPPFPTRSLTTTSPCPSSCNVGIFWDLANNKPPSDTRPYAAALRLKLAASRFGTLGFAVAFTSPNSHRRATLPDEPHPCRVCGRKFSTREKLLDHFKKLHEREQNKRIRQLESAKGARRVSLAARMSMKMEKYRRAASDVGAVMVPRPGRVIADELKRAGVWIRTAVDPSYAMREHLVDAIDEGVVGCVILVANDLGFVDVLREARLRCLKTVVVGDDRDGVLKRCADGGFSWREVMSGKARDGAVPVVGRWKDKELLTRLEWTYRPDGQTSKGGLDDEIFPGESDEEDKRFASSLGKIDSGPWWELETISSYPRR